MLRLVGLGLIVVLGMVTACADDAPKSGMVAAGAAAVGGSTTLAGSAGAGASGDTGNDGGFGEAGSGPAPVADEGGAAGALVGAGGEAGDGVSGAAGRAGAGGEAGASEATGNGGQAGQGGQGPGVCQAGDVTVRPSCSPSGSDPDGGNECRECLKASCCDAWQACYGEQPRNACGYGAPVGDEIGEADCVSLCFYDQRDGSGSDAEILDGCATACATCSPFVTDVTSALVACGYEKCPNDCFFRL